MNHLSKYGWLLLLLVCPVAAGCARSQANPGGPPALPPPEVHVSLPVEHEVTDYEDFPGRMDAVNTVEVRARISGYLEKVNFEEGAQVEKGQVLFEIDPRPYQAELDRARGNLVVSEGHLERLESDYRRAKALLPKGGMSQEDYDKIAGDRTEAQGNVKVARAARDLAELNMGFTKVVAPLSGRISRRNIDPGNLVKADETPLTVIVSLDPIYAYFDLDERTTLRLQRLIREGKVDWHAKAGLPVFLGLADEEGFPRKGTINFADNRVDSDTGTWRLRGRFDNPDRALSPGMFVRIRLPIGKPYKALLVSEEALSTDQGQKFVYVVDDENKVAHRRVKVGRLDKGLRVIASGLTPGEKVVVSGLQQIHEGVEVAPTLVPMPEGSDAVVSSQ